ncbi:MAG TPA: BON domain-containing protein [Solirubrobacteraceae bacterium]|nr:BON domain-containing protein [Solirubrobacteraceae bacterium]
MSRALTFLAGAAAGAAAAYFLDPQGGARRRSETRDKIPESVKTNVSSAASQATAQAGKVAGRAQSAVKHAVPGTGPDYDDVTLARKVESEIFRPADAPKGQVSVNAENGVVFLRGELSDPSWIERLGSEAERVDGVKEVRNLLHAAGTPAPAPPAST